MTMHRFKVPIEALEKTVLALQCLGIENYSLVENEESLKSELCDIDHFPLASEFFLETDEHVESLKALGFSFEIIEEESYPEYEQAPIEIGDFIINPRQIPLYLEGSMAFGTGHHPTTKLCLEGIIALKGHCIQSVLDLGSGTGVLAVAASKAWREGVSVESAETFLEMQARVKIGLEKVFKRSEPVLIVAHGGVYWCLRAILGFEFEDTHNATPYFFRPPTYEHMTWLICPI